MRPDKRQKTETKTGKTRLHEDARKTRQDETSGGEDKRTATKNKANDYKRSVRPRENQTRQDKTRHGEDKTTTKTRGETKTKIKT